MFTGIIECKGQVLNIEEEGSNKHFTIKSNISSSLKIDQSIAHNGVCLTVVAMVGETHTVTAIKETLEKSNLNELRSGDEVNLERCMKMGDRLDGHIVQGHVDTTGVVKAINENAGSWEFTFSFNEIFKNLIVPKGSICVNGVSLTVVDALHDSFSVAIIPYTFEHTTFNNLAINDKVNLEFDILGKYVQRMLHRD
jgi:riboflavin synthase